MKNIENIVYNKRKTDIPEWVIYEWEKYCFCNEFKKLPYELYFEKASEIEKFKIIYKIIKMKEYNDAEKMRRDLALKKIKNKR